MNPMLARTFGPKFSHYPCYVQPKLNGVRALYCGGVFQSRDEKLWQPGVLRHLVDQLESIPAISGLILDGELYRHGWRLQRINGAIAVNRKEPVADTLEVEYHVFDCIDPQRPELKFSERVWDLPLRIKHSQYHHPQIKWVPTSKYDYNFPPGGVFNDFVADGYEGLMLRPDGPYEPSKRSKYLYKWKSWTDSEFLCVGAESGQGKAAIGIGSLKLVTSNGEIFNCGTGFADEERIELAQKPPINQFVRVRFPYLSDSGVPQCPAFLAVM